MKDEKMHYKKVEWPKAKIDNLHPADAADKLEELSLEEQQAFIRSQPLEVSAESITEMESMKGWL